MFRLSEFRSKALGLPDLIQAAAFVDEGVAMLKDGSFMSSAIYYGPDLASSTESQLEHMAAQANSAFCRMQEGWSLHVDVIRRPAAGYPDSKFAQKVTTLIERERKENFLKRDAQFDNDFVMTLHYTPPPSSSSYLFSLIESNDDQEDKTSNHTKELSKFKVAVEDMWRLIAANGEIAVFPMDSEQMLQFMYAALTGSIVPLRMPLVPMYLDALLGAHDFVGGNEPRIGHQHIRVISIAGLPATSTPGMLSVLAEIPLMYRWNTRFIPVDRPSALKEINKFRSRWAGAKVSMKDMAKLQAGSTNVYESGDAANMANDANMAHELASNDAVKFGYYTSTLIIMDEDRKRVDAAAKEIRKAIENKVGFVAAIETVNAVEAYLGSQPGHRYENVRKPLLHTYNLADLLPLTRVYPGQESNPCPFYPENSPPLLFAETTGSTPFRLNLHVDDVGHTLILGPTGAGKSTLLALLTAQLFRYPNAQVFFFDKGYSVYPLCKASGGVHYDLMGESTDIAFYPLRDIHQPDEMAWAIDWVVMLFELQKFHVTAKHRATITNALNLLAHDAVDRSLGGLQSKLGDVEMASVLDPYIRGGQMGDMLDAVTDSFQTSNFQVFELDHLMGRGNDSDKWVVPVLLYIFRQIERRLDGRPTYIFLDEAWLMLDHPLFQATIKEWLKTLRKKNCAVVFATQSISDVMKSQIADVILESCPTKILLPNPEAETENLRDTYQRIGLNSTEIGIIKNAIKKEQYYVMSPKGKRLISLGLKRDTVGMAFVGASGKEDLTTVRGLIAQYGDTPDDWVPHWLNHKGLEHWTRRYRDLK